MVITIHAAVADDAESIAILSRQTFLDTFAAFNEAADMDKFMRESFSLPVLMAEVKNAEYIFLKACVNKEIVGYAKLIESPGPPALPGIASIEISRLYAVKKTIGQGVGTALMDACIKIAVEKNKAVVWLGVWEQNRRAIAFYKKAGFEKFGEQNFILGDDVQCDWLMKKIL